MALDSRCPDCEPLEFGVVSRRQFVQAVGATAAVASLPAVALRGSPHVHVWAHVADDQSLKITTAG